MRDPATLSGSAVVDGNAVLALEALREAAWCPDRVCVGAMMDIGFTWFFQGGYCTLVVDEDGDGWCGMYSDREAGSVCVSCVSDPADLPALVAWLREKFDGRMMS